MEPKIVCVDGGSRHIVGIPKDFALLESMDYFISVFDKSCKFKKKFKGIEVEFTCPKYGVCDKITCIVAEELRELQRKVER